PSAYNNASTANPRRRSRSGSDSRTDSLSSTQGLIEPVTAAVGRSPDQSAWRDTQRARPDPHPGSVYHTCAFASPFAPTPPRLSAVELSGRRRGTAGIARSPASSLSLQATP